MSVDHIAQLARKLGVQSCGELETGLSRVWLDGCIDDAVEVAEMSFWVSL